MEQEKLTVEQIYYLKYFWEEKRDLERYAEFEELKPKIEKEFPELLKAWNDYKESIERMNNVVNSI